MKKNDTAKCPSIRVIFSCSREEYALMRSLCAKSMSRSFSEYARKTLLKHPVAITSRNLSLDALIEELNEVRNQVEQLMEQHPTLVRVDLIEDILHTITIISDKITTSCTPK